MYMYYNHFLWSSGILLAAKYTEQLLQCPGSDNPGRTGINDRFRLKRWIKPVVCAGYIYSEIEIPI
jgi:hypothetical protein